MTQPAIIKMKTMMRMIKYGLLVRDVMKLTNAWGTCKLARVWANGRLMAMIGTITPLTFADVSKILGISPSFNVRWKNPIIIAVSAATAALSVGVKMPE